MGSFHLLDKSEISPCSRGLSDKLLEEDWRSREESAAGRLTGRAHKCKLIRPGPWSVDDGRKIFTR